MSTNLVLSRANLPAHLQKSATARQSANELAQGVTAGFPLISYRGKVWRIRKGGEETAFVNRRNEPVPSIEVVLVRSNPALSKSYYDKAFEEGDNSAPRCWSSNGATPDAAVKDPIHAACATCPMNQWGSRITENGKKGRKCSDVRRMAVAFASELKKKGADAHLLLLRVPPASLNPLKDYAEKMLAPAGLDYWVVETRIGFDPQAAHPKLQFSVNLDDNDAPLFLDEATYNAVMQLRESEEAHRVLSESEFTGAETEDAGASTPTSAASAPTAAAPAARANKSRPVDEEDVPTTTVASPAVTVGDDDEDEDDDDDGEEDAAAKAAAEAAAAAAAAAAVAKAAKKAAKAAKKSAAAPAPASEPEVLPKSDKAAAPAAASQFDDMLESLLGR